MKALIWKELQENVKWVPVPGLVILLLFLIHKPEAPMLGLTEAYYYCLVAVMFGALLGFAQIYFEATGDKRSLLLHRPLSPSRIFLAKALVGVGLYTLALGVPFAYLECWYATPGNLAVPFHWRTCLPWLTDILSGFVSCFAGMLVAQREARWYGSRCLALAAAILCSCLVWALPEFWQKLLAIGVFVFLVGVAAWGSFCAGGAYTPQPRLAKAALTMTFLAGLFILSMFGKRMIGECLDPGMHYQVDVDRQGRVLYSVGRDGSDDETITDADGHVVDLKHNRFWRADSTMLDWPLHWGYRHNGRFHVEIRNDSKPGNEGWYYDHALGRLSGYDRYYHQPLGSFGPDGFTPAGEQPGEPFSGKLRFVTNPQQYITDEYLSFPGGLYTVDFAQRTTRTLFTPAAGEKHYVARKWRTESNGNLVVVSTDKAFHLLTEDGRPLVSFPRAFPSEKYGPIFVGRFEDPRRYYVWYTLRLWLREPYEYRTEPSYLLEYDDTGHEVARRAVPPYPYPAASYAQALFGLVTPMTEAAALVEATKHLRAEVRLKSSIRKPVLLGILEKSKYFIPGTSRQKETPIGLISGYIALMLLSAAASALGCFLLARLYAFSRARCMSWALLGSLFGWVGLCLMLVLQDWPARIHCHKCQKRRVVTRSACEYCGSPHAPPPADGTEIFEPFSAKSSLSPAMSLSVGRGLPMR